MQVSPQKRCKQSYIKHREYRRRKKKTWPITLATINENYATNSFPNKFHNTYVKHCVKIYTSFLLLFMLFSTFYYF